MKTKLLTLLTLLVCVCTGAWADAVTIGLTQDYSVDKSTDEGAKTWSSTTIVDDNIAITQQIGSKILNYNQSTAKGAAYIDGTGHGTGRNCWRVGDPGTAYDDQYVGYDATVASGKIFNITSINARALYISSALTWKLQILSNTDAVLYESSEMTMNNNTTSPKVAVTVSSLPAADQEKLQGISGSFKVRLWAKGGKTKYFGIDQLTITGEIADDVRTTYTITASVADGQSSYGSIDKAGDNEVAEGESIVLTASANDGYNFIKWTKDDVEYATTASITLEDVTANATYVANFAQATTVKYPKTYAGTYGKMGTNYSPANGVNEKYADKDNHFTIPSYMHKYFYREGYRFKNWQVVNDGTSNRYDSGDDVTILAAAISSNQATLNPCFVATTKTVADATEATDVTWSFNKNDMVFLDWQCGDAAKYEYYTVTATIAGEQIDIPMKITSGKVANYARSDDMAQTNSGTKFTIPAVKGMTVVIADAYTAFSTTTVAGSTEYTKSNNDKTLTYTYTGEASTIDIVIGENNQYLKSIQVTYPKATVSGTITPAGWSTFASSKPLDLSTISGGTAYYASAASGSTVTLTPTGDVTVPAGEGIMVKGTAGETFTIDVAASGTAISGNLLKGQTTTGNVAASTAGAYHYVFGYKTSDATEFGFYNLASDTEVAAGKAYLETTTALGGGSARVAIVFEDEEATGIADVRDNMGDVNGNFYDLSGRKVAQPTKGLYIVNGKKVIIK